MAFYKRLTLDQMPEAKTDVNLDMATYLEPNDGWTRIHFGHDHHVDVKETPDQIKNSSRLSNMGGDTR